LCKSDLKPMVNQIKNNWSLMTLCFPWIVLYLQIYYLFLAYLFSFSFWILREDFFRLIFLTSGRILIVIHMLRIILIMNGLGYLFYICVDWRFPFLVILYANFLFLRLGVGIVCCLRELSFIGFDVLRYFVRLLCWFCCLLLFCMFFLRFGNF